MGLAIGFLIIFLILFIVFTMALAEWADKDPGEFFASIFAKRSTATSGGTVIVSAPNENDLKVDVEKSDLERKNIIGEEKAIKKTKKTRAGAFRKSKAITTKGKVAKVRSPKNSKRAVTKKNSTKK